jgi:hypothetical protein
MKAHVKVGRKEGFVSSYNLFFDNGLRLQTEDLTWKTADDRTRIGEQFLVVVAALKAAGVEVEGGIV